MKRGICGMVIFLMLGVFLLAQERVIESSSKSMPNWVRKAPQETEYIFSVGMRTGANTIEEGETQARLNALNKLFETYFGIKGRSVYQKVRKNLETEYLHSMKVESKGELWGIKLSDWYWKKYEVKSPSGIEYRYDVWVLLQGKKADIEKAVKRITKRIEETKKNSKVSLIEAKMALTDYNVKKSLQKIQKAQELVKTLDDEFFVKEIYIESDALFMEIMRDLKIERLTDKTLTPQSGKLTPMGLKVKITYKGYPQQRIPVEFIFSRGSGLLKSPVYTDREGIATSSISKIDSPLKPSAIEAKISYEGGNAVQFFVKPLPIKVGVLITIYEEVNNEKISPGILRNKLLQTFTEAGFSVKKVELSESEIQWFLAEKSSIIREVAQNYDADYIIVGEVKTRLMPETEGIFFANAYGVLKVIDGKTGKIIISEVIDENGGGLNKSQAAHNALRNAADKAVPELKEKIGETLGW